MPKNVRKHELGAVETPERPSLQSVKKQKLPVLLITADESLWPQIGADLSSGLILKQLDSIDELVSSTSSGSPGIVLWDARNNADPASVLSRVNLHSSRFAIIALDDATSADAWTLPVQHRQIVAHVGLPIVDDLLASALEAAQEEVNSRVNLLGDSGDAIENPTAPTGKPWLVPALIGAVVAAAAIAYFATRGNPSEPKTASSPSSATPAATPASAPAKAEPAPATATKSVAEIDEKVDALIEKAQQAMLERHFIDPVAGSALSLYREVLVISPDNGEAKQGLQRLAEILIARVQSALDDRKFDVALQSLETARSIDANDKRLAALDEKITSLRAEIGPAQILAAINAQNFDRATQLIDEAARTKLLPAAKLAQLRDEVHRRRDDFEVARLLKLVDARIQQDHVIDPHDDSAVFFLSQAKQAGASAAAMQVQAQDLTKRLTQMAHAAMQLRNFTDADRIINEMHTMGAAQAAVNSVQRELNLARNQSISQKPDQPQYLELAQARLAQGKLTEPDNDSALYYVNQLRAADPKSSGLAQITASLQAQILDRARALLDAGDVEKTETLAQSAASLGASSDLDALTDRIRQKKSGSGGLQMPEQSLTRVNKLDVQYPTRALQTNIEGWVEIGYTISPDGSVTNVKVLNSSPPKVFEAASIRAVSKLRYQPVVQSGKAIAVETQVRIVYRVPK